MNTPYLLILDLCKGDYDFKHFNSSRLQTIQIVKNSLVFKLSSPLRKDREIQLDFNEFRETLEKIANEARDLISKGISVQIQREGDSKIKLYTPLD